MCDVLKILNFEKRKLLSNKSFLILIICVIFITICISIFSFLIIETNVVHDVTDLQKDHILLSYKEEIVKYKELLESPLLKEVEKKIYLDRINKYEFFIKNDIIEYECIEFIPNSLFKYSNNLGVSFMLYLITILFIPLIIYTFLISIYVFSDVANGMIKNIVASGISKKSIYKGKLLFQITLNLIVVLAVFIIVLLIGILNIDAKLILKINSTYYLVNALLFLVLQIIGLFFILCLCSIFFNFIISIFKNSLYSTTSILILLCFAFLCSLMIQKYIDINSLEGIYSVDQFIPILNIKYYFEYIQPMSILIILIHIVISLIVIKINEIIFEKCFS